MTDGAGRASHGWARGLVAGVALLSGAAGCAAAQSCPPLGRLLDNARYTLAASDQDSVTVRDIRRGLEAALIRIPADLGQPLTHRVAIEMYPTQACYDAHVMDEHSRGTPAVSGDWRIQLVSPRSPIRAQGIPYRARLEFVEHEIAHLVLNEMNRHLPMWLTEGVPTFEGSRSVYREVGRRYLGGQIAVPSFQRLVTDYDSLQGADVLAFTVVEFIAERFGQTRLNRIIRAPDAMQSILGVPAAEFDRDWQAFVRDRYTAAGQGAGTEPRKR